jgi:hypothetical protein
MAGFNYTYDNELTLNENIAAARTEFVKRTGLAPKWVEINWRYITDDIDTGDLRLVVSTGSRRGYIRIGDGDAT